MHYIKRTILAALLLVIHLPLQVMAQTNDDPTELILEMLPAVCGEFPTSGSSSSFSISGDANTKLKGLLDKLADLGIDGAVDVDTDEYVGVLRSEVGEQLNSVRDCRERVWSDMRSLIVKEESTNGSDPVDGDALLAQHNRACKENEIELFALANSSGEFIDGQFLQSTTVKCTEGHCRIWQELKPVSPFGQHEYAFKHVFDFLTPEVRVSVDGLSKNNSFEIACDVGRCISGSREIIKHSALEFPTGQDSFKNGPFKKSSVYFEERECADLLHDAVEAFR